jgi:hypothetical protein
MKRRHTWGTVQRTHDDPVPYIYSKAALYAPLNLKDQFSLQSKVFTSD